MEPGLPWGTEALLDWSICGSTFGGHNQGQQGGWQDSLLRRTLGLAPSTSIRH